MTSLTGQSAKQSDPPVASPKKLPTMYDLPSEFPEEPGLPDEFHDYQPQLLSRTLSLGYYTANNLFFPGTDINLYYDSEHPLWHKRPDWFLAVNVPRLYNGDSRSSYVTWDEGQSPSIVVEFLSPNTEKQDLGRFYEKSDKVPDDWPKRGIVPEAFPLADSPEKGRAERTTPPDKFMVYEEYLKVPHYIVYSKYTKQLRYFRHNGSRYEEQTISNETPLIWLPDLEIGLGLWNGYFEGLPGPWLRWCDLDGRWALTDTEEERLAKEEERLAKEEERLAKEEERLAKEEERLAKEQAQAQAARLAARLRELGIDPNEI